MLADRAVVHIAEQMELFEGFRMEDLRVCYVFPGTGIPVGNLTWCQSTFHTDRDTEKITLEAIEGMRYSVHATSSRSRTGCATYAALSPSDKTPAIATS